MKKIESIPVKEAKSPRHIVDLIHGTMDMAYREDIQYLSVHYKIAGRVYKYTVGNK